MSANMKLTKLDRAIAREVATATENGKLRARIEELETMVSKALGFSIIVKTCNLSPHILSDAVLITEELKKALGKGKTNVSA